MALTKEIILQNEGLKTLTPEQLQAIETLSTNDENAVIAKKVGEIHGAYEKDFAEFGFKKPEGWRSKEGKTQIYHYVKEEVLPKLTGVKELETKLSTAEGKVKELETKIAAGATDETVKQQLKDAQKQFGDLQKQYNTEKADWENKVKTEQEKLNSTLVDFEFQKSLTGLKFKDETALPGPVKEAFINNVKNEILGSFKPDFVQNGNGKTLVFRDANGEIVTNPNNALNPTTVSDLLSKKLEPILDSKKQQGGAGAGGKGAAGAGQTVDLASAKTQVEADTIIRTSLMEQGFKRGTPELSAKQAELRKENSEFISKLPIN